MSISQTLGYDHYLLIFSKLDARSIITCKQVSHFWNRIANNETLWEFLKSRDYPNLKKFNLISWQESYINRVISKTDSAYEKECGLLTVIREYLGVRGPKITIPEDHLISYLFPKMDAKTLFACMQVSQNWQVMASDESLWKSLMLKDYPRINLESSNSWKEKYIIANKHNIRILKQRKEFEDNLPIIVPQLLPIPIPNPKRIIKFLTDPKRVKTVMVVAVIFGTFAAMIGTKKLLVTNKTDEALFNIIVGLAIAILLPIYLQNHSPKK